MLVFVCTISPSSEYVINVYICIRVFRLKKLKIKHIKENKVLTRFVILYRLVKVVLFLNVCKTTHTPNVVSFLLKTSQL